MTKKKLTASESIIASLVNKGANRRQLTDTNINVVRYHSKDLLFVNDMNSLVPFIYGVFATSHVYLGAILSEKGIAISEQADGKIDQEILVTKNGYIGCLRPQEASTDLKQLAGRVLEAFPGASYICFSIPDHASVESINQVSNVTFSLDSFVGSKLHKNGQSQDAITVITEMIIDAS